MVLPAFHLDQVLQMRESHVEGHAHLPTMCS